MSTLPPASTQPHNQLVLGALSFGIKQPILEGVFLPHLVTRLKIRAAIHPFSLYASMVGAEHLSSFLPECT